MLTTPGMGLLNRNSLAAGEAPDGPRSPGPSRRPAYRPLARVATVHGPALDQPVRVASCRRARRPWCCAGARGDGEMTTALGRGSRSVR
jgi:hypothetical protein